MLELTWIQSNKHGRTGDDTDAAVVGILDNGVNIVVCVNVVLSVRSSLRQLGVGV